MNKQEANEWLKSVTGSKIRRVRWLEGSYTIPNGEWYYTSTNNPCHWIFKGVNERGKKDYSYVDNGFEEDIYGGKWELLETFDDYLEMYYKD